MRPNLQPLVSRTKQHGFSMIEILITLVLVAIAILGTAGLQLNAMRLNKGSQWRTQAIFLASDMVERMEANKIGAVAGNYALALASAPSAALTDCTGSVCDPSSLAAWDKQQWGLAIQNTKLPQANWSITRTIVGNPSTYDIFISWIDRGDAKTATSSTIVDSLTVTRTLNN